MPKNHFFRSSSVTTAAIPGGSTATASGIGGGFSQSALAAQKASAVLSANSGHRDSLFNALKVLFEDQPQMVPSVLETYLPELNDGLIATDHSIAFVVRNVLLSVYSGATHLAQVPSDLSSVIKHTGHGLSHIEIPSDKIEDAFHKTSTFKPEAKGSFQSMQSVSEALGKQAEKVMDGLNKDFPRNNSHASGHAQFATTIAGVSIGVTGALPTALALGTDLVGQTFKEISATSHFVTEESASRDGKKNVYVASSDVSKAAQNSDSQQSKVRSLELDDELSNMDRASNLLSNQSITSPINTVLIRLIALSLFVKSSRALNKASLVMSEGRLKRAIVEATAQGSSGGVDRINSLHANFSSLSNILRLCADNLKGPTAIETTVRSSEVISSRSMSVLLTNVSKLADLVRQLFNQQPVNQEENSASVSTNRVVDLAQQGVLNNSEAMIKAILDRIEQENGQHVIPGLNQDMASQLNTTSQSGLASLLLTHSVFTNPILLAKKASKGGVNTNEAQKNEALMEMLPSLTQGLNLIQASTRNMMQEMEHVMGQGSSKNDGSLLSPHHTGASNTATLYWVISAIFLICDEMLCICRSLSLIDKNRANELSQKINELPSKDESAQSSEQIAWDSHSQQERSATHAITALRLTLSHSGVSLMRIAMALHHAVENHMDTEQQNLAMHTLQRTLLSSGAETLRSLVEGSFWSTGGTLALPVLSNGSANWSHMQAHSTDQNLHPIQTHESEQSSKESTETFQPIGFFTDAVAGTVINVLKVLAQGSLVGLDTTIELIKILEILSVHRDSLNALRVESNDSSNPNGLSKNVIEDPSAGSSAGTGAILINMLASLQTLDQSAQTQSTLSAQERLKQLVDQQIEGLAVLDDDEEGRDNKKGLKEFYRVIIRLLAPQQNEQAQYDLVRRLDCGGIALSSYHSLFGAYDEEPRSDLRFIGQFANDDDAQGLLRRFIDEAKKRGSPLLRSLHNALPEDQRSAKAQVLFEHVFEEVYQRYKQVKINDIITHGSGRRKEPTRDAFKMDMGLMPVQLVQDENVEQDNTLRLM